ncbi:WXG100 family type VII secretion target [Kitasatospora sp. NPDC059646]|uniref:WXG100 family type VII secretion target n=1 Tax=Kitasatospora sp. NPDC059646 TaxID=3346893 RepID=UPI003686D4E2
MASKTRFDSYALIPLKGMVSNSSPEQIREVGRAWQSVHAELTQAAADLQAAIEHATANWSGAAAQGFAAKGAQIQQGMANTAAHAQNTSAAMNYAATALAQTKSTMAQIKVPTFMDRVGKTLSDGFASSDEGFKRDLASGMNRIDAVNKNAHDLSATEVAHQYAIGVMEHLGPQYLEAASYLDGGPSSITDPSKGFPPDPPATICPPGHTPPNVPMPQYPEGHPKDLPPPGYVPGHQPTVPMPGIPQPTDPGQHKETIYPGIDPSRPVTPPSTGLDGWKPPETGGGLPGVPGGGYPGGVGTLPGPGTGGGGTGGGGIGGGGIVPGIGGGGYLPGGGSGGGRAGGGRTGGLGTGGLGTGGSGAGKVGGAGGAAGAGRAGGAGAAGAGAGAGAAGGRGATGAGGMGGMHGGGMGGAGGAKGGGAKGGSGLVRKAGGTIGGAKAGGAGGRAFTEGGSGIGKGRGTGQGGAAGMHGAPGSGGANRKKKNEGHRPDYLTEDEETWRGGTANPPVIE